jgi:hypothetical protein
LAHKQPLAVAAPSVEPDLERKRHRSLDPSVLVPVAVLADMALGYAAPA